MSKQCRDDLYRAIEQTTGWRDRALKAEAECAELGEAMRLVGIAQFEANAARIKAEEALREIDTFVGWWMNKTHSVDIVLSRIAIAARLKAEAEVEHKRERIVSLGDQFATEHLARIKAEEALRDLLNWINPHCGIPASVIDRARAALSEGE